MSVDWSPLGGNPVPGDPGRVRGLALQFRDFADQVVRIRRSRAGNDGRERGLLIQYFVPVPGRDDIAVVAFGSPSMALENELTILFDTMASTFAFTDTDGRTVDISY